MSTTDLNTSDLGAPKRPKKKKSARKKLYEVHSWLGFHLAIVMALVLATGTIATVSHELDWLTQHDMRVSPDGEKVSWGQMFDAVQAHKPKATINSLSQMKGDHFAYRADVTDEFGLRRFVHVNQWTGEVTGETHPLTVQRFFRDLHRYLYMPNFIGLPLVTSLAFVLAVSLYTGLKTTRNWRTLLFRVRTDKGARILWGDAHKAAGLWGIWFFVVIIVTSVWYLIEFGVGIQKRATNAPPTITSERLTTEQVAGLGQTVDLRSLDDVLVAAKEAYPELNATSVSVPRSANGVFFVQGMVGNPIIRPRSNGVFLHPETLEILGVRKSREYPAYYYINEMADPLHFGNFGGLPTKLIWFVFGIAMTGLSVTGVWLTWRRLKTASPSWAQFATLPVLLACFYFWTLWNERFIDPDVPVLTALATGDVGGVRAAAYKVEDDAALRIELTAQTGRVLVQSADIELRADDEVLSSAGELVVRGVRQTAVVQHAFDADAIAGADSIAAAVRFHDGSQQTFDLPITRASSE